MMKKTIRTIIVVTIFAGLILGYYYYLSTRNSNGAENSADKQTEIEKVLDLNLNLDYPATPREVVKVYNRFLACYYNENPSEKEVKKLAAKQRALLDQELLDYNPEETYYANISADVKKHEEEKRTIQTATVCGTNEVIYKTVDARECAYVTCSYFVKVDNAFESTVQRYVLRKDEDENWKILVYYIVEGESE